MARFVNVAIVFVIFVSMALMQCVGAQTVHVVGDGMGWVVPQGGAGAYDAWAATKTFRVGDTLTFNFVTGQHDVLQVPKASYDGCTAANPIGNLIPTGPANITISSAGDHHFICTFSQHCQLGQKLKITAVSSSTPGVAPSPADCPPDTTMGPTARVPSPITPTSPPNSSSSAVLASLVVSFLSIVVVGFGFIF